MAGETGAKFNTVFPNFACRLGTQAFGEGQRYLCDSEVFESLFNVYGEISPHTEIS